MTKKRHIDPTQMELAPIAHQVEIFETFYAKRDSQEISRVLAGYDTIPKFSLNRAREAKGSRLREMSFRRNKTEIRVLIQAAEISDGRGGSRAIFPGHREEMLERVLRYMAAQQIAPMSLHKHKSPGGDQQVVVVDTTYSAIRRCLSQIGYDLNLKRIQEALKVSERSFLEVSITDDDGSCVEYRGPFLLRMKERRESGSAPEDSRLRLLFHQFAAEAILSGDHYAIAHPWVSGLKDGLSRWIVNVMTERFRGASKFKLADFGSAGPSGYTLSLQAVLERSGIEIADKSKAIERVREALRELYVAGFIGEQNDVMSLKVEAHRKSADFLETLKKKPGSYIPPSLVTQREERVAGCAFGESIQRESGKGRPKITNATWNLVPTDLFAEMIISGNVERSEARKKASI